MDKREPQDTRCVGCAVKMKETVCKCGVGQHLPRCPACSKAYSAASMQRYTEEMAEGIFKRIDDQILGDYMKGLNPSS